VPFQAALGVTISFLRIATPLKKSREVGLNQKKTLFFAASAGSNEPESCRLVNFVSTIWNVKNSLKGPFFIRLQKNIRSNWYLF
jgi:hypothetical protein